MRAQQRPNRPSPAQRLRRRVAGLATMLAAVVAAAPVAQAQSVPIVRDAEIEALMRDYARPILGAAGLDRSGIEIILVNDPSFNAFVAGRRIVFHTGALVQAETPNEIIGVLAHEAGHIAGGHQERLREQLGRAQTIAMVGAILGMGMGVASGGSGLGAVGAGIAFSAPEMARRGLMGYQRTEEATADRSAIQYLNATGQSAAGMLRTFQRMAGDLALSGVRVDPYQISHPMPRERIANLKEVAEKSPHFGKKDSPDLQRRHDMMRAKIAAYTQGQGAVQRLFRNNPQSVGVTYGDAIMTHLHGSPAAALKKVDALIKQQPGNAYLYELRGDVLIKAGRAADAVKAYETAVARDKSRSGILKVGLGQAILATGAKDAPARASKEIEAGLRVDKEYITGYRSLAQAYGQSGDVGQAELATAEGHYHAGQYREAKIFAARSQQKLRKGSPAWVRAQDIINFAIPRR